VVEDEGRSQTTLRKRVKGRDGCEREGDDLWV